jgi:predicted  nucleic acid-binding Zn-ribbon protein
LRDGLRQAKEDLDAARKGREKLMKARQTAQEETENLETQVARAEAQASAAQEALTRTRRLDRLLLDLTLTLFLSSSSVIWKNRNVAR